MVWGRTWAPAESPFIYSRKVGGGNDRVQRLRIKGCEGCQQKNWVPLQRQGTLYAEATIHPRRVRRRYPIFSPTLALDLPSSASVILPQILARSACSAQVYKVNSKGVCTPTLNTSAAPSEIEPEIDFGPARELQEAFGAEIVGGPPAVRITLPGGKQVRQRLRCAPVAKAQCPNPPIPRRWSLSSRSDRQPSPVYTWQAFLGLAHFDRSVAHWKLRLLLTHHVFYAFSPRPPFRLIALGRPFMFPSELSMLQFASGMLLRDDGDLIIAFGEQECEARRASVPLDAVLAQLRVQSVVAHGTTPASD